MSGRLPRRGRIAAPSVAAGVLLALSLPPWGWWPLGFVGAALLYWRLAGLRLRSRLWSGWLAGLGCYAIGLFWAHAFNWYGAVVLIAIEALFFAAAAGATPPRCGRALAYVGACTLAECVRMTWPFGGLPLGGVFLGQARSPLIELARLGGPLLITAGVWAGGVALATIAASLWARHGRVDGPSAIGAAAIVGGLVALAVIGTVGARRRGARPDVARRAGARGRAAGPEQAAGLAHHRPRRAAGGDVRRGQGQALPRLVLWPEDVVALDAPSGGLSAGGAPEPVGPATPHHTARRRHRAGVHHLVPQRGRGLGTRRPHRRRLREGPPGALRRVRSVPLAASRTSPTCRGCRSTPFPATARGSCAHPPARSGSWSPSRSSTPGAATSRCAPAPSCWPCPPTRPPTAPRRCRRRRWPRRSSRRRDRARPRAGRPDRIQRGGHPTGRRPPAQRARPAPGALRHRRATPRLHALRPLGGSPACSYSPHWLSSPGGSGSCATRSSPSGCRRRARRPPRTWRGWTGRPRRRGAGRSRGPGGPRPPTA